MSAIIEQIADQESLEANIETASLVLKYLLSDTGIPNLLWAYNGSRNLYFSIHPYIEFMVGFEGPDKPMIRVSVPAIPVSEARIQYSPRIYVDGSSGFWNYAVETLQRELNKA